MQYSDYDINTRLTDEDVNRLATVMPVASSDTTALVQCILEAQFSKALWPIVLNRVSQLIYNEPLTNINPELADQILDIAKNEVRKRSDLIRDSQARQYIDRINDDMRLFISEMSSE